MSGMDLLPELTRQLDRLVPTDETLLADWQDILRRVEPAPGRAPQPKRRRLRLIVVAVALFLLLAGIATGTYFSLRASGGDKAHGLTIFTGDPTPAPSPLDCRRFGCGPRAAIGAVQPNGRVKILWRCPHLGYSCGNTTSIAWSPDGRMLAFTLSGFAGTGYYDGLHIVDTVTGRDLQLPRMRRGDTFSRYRQRATHDLGCSWPWPTEVAWSHDGRRLAYVCAGPGVDPPSAVGEIFVLSSDGSHWAAVPKVHGGFPSWSRDGRRIVFATGARPAHSSVYVVNLDGSVRTLVARNGTAPAWSPDGRTIAYRARCGLRLVTLSGKDVTPVVLTRECAKASPGFPAWSPEGRRLAFAAPDGIYVVNTNGTGLARVTRALGRGVFGPVRPAWTPTPRVVHSSDLPPAPRRCC